MKISTPNESDENWIGFFKLFPIQLHAGPLGNFLKICWTFPFKFWLEKKSAQTPDISNGTPFYGVLCVNLNQVVESTSTENWMEKWLIFAKFDPNGPIENWIGFNKFISIQLHAGLLGKILKISWTWPFTFWLANLLGIPTDAARLVVAIIMVQIYAGLLGIFFSFLAEVGSNCPHDFPDLSNFKKWKLKSGHKLCINYYRFKFFYFYSILRWLVGEFRDLSRADTELTFWPKKNEKFGQRPLASDWS